jgi:hypothetical protein
MNQIDPEASVDVLLRPYHARDEDQHDVDLQQMMVLQPSIRVAGNDERPTAQGEDDDVSVSGPQGTWCTLRLLHTENYTLTF